MTMFRPSLILATVMALPLVVLGAAPAGRGHATSTRVAGIDVDATTIPQFQKLMDAHRLSSVRLVQFYLHRIAKLNPELMRSSKCARTPSPTHVPRIGPDDRLMPLR